MPTITEGVQTGAGDMAQTVYDANQDDKIDATALNDHAANHEDGGSDEIDVAGLSGELADNQPPKVHALNHQDTGGDEINVTGLAGLLADNQNPTAHSGEHTDGTDDIQNASDSQKGLATANQTLTDVIVTIDGGGSTITAGIKDDIHMDFTCTIKQVVLLADQAGNITIDLWKDTYTNAPPTVVDTITASAKPTLSAAAKSKDTTLSGWTTSVAVDDVIRVNVDSASTVTRVTMILKVAKS